MRPRLPFCGAQTLLLLLAAASALAGGPQLTTVRPADTGAALCNPGMGWMFHHYDNDIRHYTVDLAPADGVDEFPGVCAVYLRLAWSYLEPEEGRFEWSLLDTPVQKWLSKGKQVAFRFTTSEGSPRQPYATPRWVEKAGAKGYHLDGRGIAANGPVWEPDFDDPVFLEKLDRFLAAAAARYDGHPGVAFIDVGSFGVWGEGHTAASTKLPYSAATVRRHIDLYRKHFHRTLLVANDDFALQGRGLETLGYARDAGLGLRDDSILVEAGPNAYHHAFLAHDFWPRVPVVLETQHWGESIEDKAWGDGSGLMDAIEAYHASYVTVHWYPREFLEHNRELVNRVNLRFGYRLRLEEISWTPVTPAGGAIQVTYRWRNTGVAPCLAGGHPTVTLKTAGGGIAGVFVDDDFDVRSLPPGRPGEAPAISRRELEAVPQNDKPILSYRLPPSHILKAGEYEVYVSVGDSLGTPRIALALPGDDGSRRYRLGTIRITAER